MHRTQSGTDAQTDGRRTVWLLYASQSSFEGMKIAYGVKG